MQIGFLDRTPRGRVATQLAYEHFGITPDAPAEFAVLIAYSQRTANCRKYPYLCLLRIYASSGCRALRSLARNIRDTE